jgi:predicted TIM-barrel fold metal-dependent hydrolase
VLERLERRSAPLFVHPGPAAVPAGAESWWPAVTGYVAGLQRAWVAWLAHGSPAHPELRVLFAALAGLAPLHRERLLARGARLCAAHPNMFYDTSSYGEHAVGWMAETVGRSQLVYGSDRPFALPGIPADDELATNNPARLLHG